VPSGRSTPREAAQGGLSSGRGSETCRGGRRVEGQLQLPPAQTPPDQLEPLQLLPLQLEPDQDEPDQLLPLQVIPDQEEPDQLEPLHVQPDQELPDQLDPDQLLPFQMPPDQLAPAASALASVVELSVRPKMSFSPERRTPFIVTRSVPREASIEPVPLAFVNVCEDDAGALVSMAVRLISPAP
jgi:hypothetical protein